MPVKQSGMTLLEVLLALSIFAAASMALMSAIGGQTNATMRISERALAGWIADNSLSEQELLSLPVSAENDKQQGAVEMAGQSWNWTSAVSLDEGTGMHQQTIQVFQSNGQFYSLSRYSPVAVSSKK